MSDSRAEDELIEAIVRRVLEELGGGAPSERAAQPLREDVQTFVANARNPAALERIVRSTPARLGVGRSGTRYLTKMYLRLRGDHAIAKDAVYSEVPADFAKGMDAIDLRTRARDRATYLLRPDEGRALHPESRAVLEQAGARNADVQVVMGDGLSAWALLTNAAALVPALEGELNRRGFSLGRRMFVRFARIAVADEIGVALGARSTVILVGERPGLGTGDSLSAYIAWGPKLGQDNAEKNCVSNIRPLGLQPMDAARDIGEILSRARELGHGGVAAAASASRKRDERGGPSAHRGRRSGA